MTKKRPPPNKKDPVYETDPAKRKYSKRELDNDPTLKLYFYRRWEVVWSDVHNAKVRFARYNEDGTVTVATINGMADLLDVVHPLQIRRV